MKTITPDLDEYFNHVISVLDRRLWEAERIAHSEIAESGGFITKIFTLGEAAAHLATAHMSDSSSMTGDQQSRHRHQSDDAPNPPPTVDVHDSTDGENDLTPSEEKRICFACSIQI